MLIASIGVVLAMGSLYQINSITGEPEAHAHNGRTTVAGWIHGVFAVPALWVISTTYFGLTKPTVSRIDLTAISVVLTPFLYLGVMKFNKRWKLDRFAKRQVAILAIVLWLVTILRLRWI